ncbi:MAG TPA: SpoIIE family protein phosphatase [Bryobacteraceae bacterium]|jgi:sigma-B regulation protein RsbU (phosphoserine phosphatase)|nr:SpoIIE family protein phosphatase [Bryobacteraceae bacterium]
MAGVAAKFIPRELLVHTPDGAVRPLLLERDRYSLGRSSANELCYPEDAGLSRQHLVLERDTDTWTVRDLGSKNGTFVNGVRITSPYPLGKNDRVTAGHIALDFGENSLPPPEDKTVIFIEGMTPTTSVSTTVATSLKGVLSQDKEIESNPQMRALIRAGRELAGNMPLAELFKLIMNLSVEAVGATRGVLMTLEGAEGSELVVRQALGEGFRISNTVRDRVIKEKTSLLVRDARLDEAFADRMSIVQQQIRSMLAVPLQTDDRVIGLIYLDSPHFIKEFTKDDLSLLTVMANVAAIRIEHTRLAEVEQAERIHAKQLEQAAEIQRGLLPVQAPDVAGVDLAGYNAACHTVGGDYYDFLPYPDGRVGILVGDVAGKGMPAALLMSSLQARVQVLFDDPENLAALVTRLNRIITSNCPSNRFITFFIGILDPKTGNLTYVNAGHNPPLVAHADGSVEKLEGTGLILGILAVAAYTQKTCNLAPGDALLLFSDGVSEPVRPDSDEEFGEDRLAQSFAKLRDQDAQSIIDTINQQVREFTGGLPLPDDITLVVAKRLPS